MLALNTSQVAMLWNDTNTGMVLRAREAQDAAAKLGRDIRSLEHFPIRLNRCSVMAALVAAIHALLSARKSWMRGSSPHPHASRISRKHHPEAIPLTKAAINAIQRRVLIGFPAADQEAMRIVFEDGFAQEEHAATGCAFPAFGWPTSRRSRRGPIQFHRSSVLHSE
jgi:hypothetical protein